MYKTEKHWLKGCIRQVSRQNRSGAGATTAPGTIHPKGRELGILAGTNVVMPNLFPTEVRKDYLLYDNKICTGDQSAQCRSCLERRMETIGYHVVTMRGDPM